MYGLSASLIQSFLVQLIKKMLVWASLGSKFLVRDKFLKYPGGNLYKEHGIGLPSRGAVIVD